MTIAALQAPTAAYLHVPFCAHRCGYCDFTLIARRDDLIDAYLQGMAIDLASLRKPRRVQTLFLGGGTPTHLPAQQLSRLLALAREWFPLEDNFEFSVEANPAGLDDEKIAVLAEFGVNRISLGVQSFDVHILRTLERNHNAAMVADAVSRLRRRFDNISLDLIFGVPGQTLDLWRETLTQAMALEPQHISTYGLTFEKGTSFWSRRSKGQLAQLPDELEREMYALAMDNLAAAGFIQYELSNFARPGWSCRHNETYWAALSYYGHGPGAARYLAGRRETNHRSVTTWIAHTLAGKSAIGDAEELSPEDRAREALILGLRRVRGVDRNEFFATTGYDLDRLLIDRVAGALSSGLIEQLTTGYRLTREGRFVADSIIVDLL